MLIIVCKDDSGFEDQMTDGTNYKVQEEKNNSYLILNDNGEKRWYGKVHFDVSSVSL